MAPDYRGVYKLKSYIAYYECSKLMLHKTSHKLEAPYKLVQTRVEPPSSGPPIVKGDGKQPSNLVLFTKVGRCHQFKMSHFGLSQCKSPMQDEHLNAKSMLFSMLDVRIFV